MWTGRSGQGIEATRLLTHPEDFCAHRNKIPDHSKMTTPTLLLWFRQTKKPATKPRTVRIPNTIPRTASTGNCALLVAFTGDSVGTALTVDVALAELSFGGVVDAR